ncbi:hypothetical protein A5875_001631, partial [Enterococcus sp. 3H8_DIV0648]
MGNEVESKKRVTIVSLQMVKGTLYT